MNCPVCGSMRVYPSRLRNAYERLWEALTAKQPYRCHECGWRKWRQVFVHPAGPDIGPDDLRTGRAPRPVTPTELDELDGGLDPAAPDSRPTSAGRRRSR